MLTSVDTEPIVEDFAYRFLLSKEMWDEIKDHWSSHVAPVVMNLPANAGDARAVALVPGWDDPLGQPTAVFLSGESHGQRSLEGYGP